MFVASEKISELVDHSIKPLIPGTPSFIRDSFDFLGKLRSLRSLPDGFILITIDVVGLYPSIPHDDGLGSLSEFLDTHHYNHTIRDGICELAHLVLKRNIFEFGNDS